MFLNSSNSEVLNALDEIERYLNGEENYINIKAFKKNSQITKKITNICNILNKKMMKNYRYLVRLCWFLKNLQVEF
ncbi:MAG: hypothetical protein PHS78_04430 [Aliarcobacter skirrowii]|uniref:hypothetical protein n=1 Tax=Aliarcobacter skirrowii TaxID=28200 RepID=UPI00242E1151|nr:hypothetical protein [Aliarcobacter skirrowii]MDD2508267.1 hypothetical protein [Aliarcobacter skirrowii]MDD3496667.1 hypothetical protein [Aliarcobacter skirrowii]